MRTAVTPGLGWPVAPSGDGVAAGEPSALGWPTGTAVPRPAAATPAAQPPAEAPVDEAPAVLAPAAPAGAPVEAPAPPPPDDVLAAAPETTVEPETPPASEPEGATPAVEVAAADPTDPPGPDESPGPPHDDAARRESLVREAMARVAAAPDVSRETPPPTLAAEVSRETGLGDVSRETDAGDTPIAAAAAAAVRAARTPFPKPRRPRILTVANQKGGVGKTTSTVNIGAGLAQRGLDVLVIDLDPQGNASTALGIEHHEGVPNMYDVLVGDRTLDDVVQPTPIPNLLCAPATVDLAGAEIELVPAVAREARLKRALGAYTRPYDYVLIDCPPSLGLLTVNALVAAKEILIPIQCEFYALEGLGQLLHNVELIRSHLNERLEVSTILLTMYDGRTRLADQVANEVRAHFGERVLDVMIPRSVRVSEAPGYGQTVLTYDPSSRGAVAYVEAARQIAERGARTEET